MKNKTLKVAEVVFMVALIVFLFGAAVGIAAAIVANSTTGIAYDIAMVAAPFSLVMILIAAGTCLFANKFRW